MLFFVCVRAQRCIFKYSAPLAERACISRYGGAVVPNIHVSRSRTKSKRDRNRARLPLPPSHRLSKTQTRSVA